MISYGLIRNIYKKRIEDKDLENDEEEEMEKEEDEIIQNRFENGY